MGSRRATTLDKVCWTYGVQTCSAVVVGCQLWMIKEMRYGIFQTVLRKLA